MRKLLSLPIIVFIAGCSSGGGQLSDVGKSKADSAEFRNLLDASMEELRLKTEAHNGIWHIGEANWSLDQGTGRIVFTTPKGFTATAPTQIVGTFNTRDGTWLWAWDNPSIVPALQEHARKVKEYGEKHGITVLTTRKIRCTEDEAWELGALTCKLCEAQGTYRGPSDQKRVMMTFGKVKLKKSESPEVKR